MPKVMDLDVWDDRLAQLEVSVQEIRLLRSDDRWGSLEVELREALAHLRSMHRAVVRWQS